MADQQLNIKLNAVDNTSKAFSGVKGSILSLKNALIGLGIGAVIKPIIDITKEFETLRTTLRFVTGSVEGGQRAFGLLRNLSKQTQFSTKELADTFITLQNSGIEPTDELLRTFIDTASATANSLDTLNDLTRLFAKGATGAGIGSQSLSQLASKGIPVFQILEKELGLTRSQLNKFADDAEGSAVILEALERGLANTFGGASSQRAGDLAIVFKNLFENLKDVADLIATDGGFSTSFKELLKSFGELLTTLAPVIAILGKLLNFVTELANVGLVLLNNSLKLVLGTLDKVVTKLGKVVGYGSGIPQTMGLDEDRTVAPPEITKAKIEDKSFIGLLEGKLKGEIALADLAFKNLNKTLAEGVVIGVKNISVGIAESIVLGKKLTDTFRELTQKVLVKILSQLIEEQLIRIALLALDQLKLAISKQQTAEIAKQNVLLSQQQSMGGGGGGGFLSTIARIGFNAFAGGGSVPLDAPNFYNPVMEAEGGSVRGGMPITVGERGRELFVPNTSGTIVPNHDIAGTGTNITFNIQANDVRGIKELLIDNRATIINLVNQGANQKGKSNVV
jgi:hypothetical protein